MADFDEFLRELKGLRDELALRVHLATMEARDEWDEMETKWREFSSRAEMDRTAGGVADALTKLGDELKAGYDRIRGALKD